MEIFKIEKKIIGISKTIKNSKFHKSKKRLLFSSYIVDIYSLKLFICIDNSMFRQIFNRVMLNLNNF